MKILIVYNENDKMNIEFIHKVDEYNLSTHVDFVELQDASRELVSLITATPAIIPIREDLQGNYIIGDNRDSSLILLGFFNAMLEEEQKVISDIEINRVDQLIHLEKRKAEDVIILDMKKRGII